MTFVFFLEQIKLVIYRSFRLHALA